MGFLSNDYDYHPPSRPYNMQQRSYPGGRYSSSSNKYHANDSKRHQKTKHCRARNIHNGAAITTATAQLALSIAVNASDPVDGGGGGGGGSGGFVDGGGGGGGC